MKRNLRADIGDDLLFYTYTQSSKLFDAKKLLWAFVEGESTSSDRLINRSTAHNAEINARNHPKSPDAELGNTDNELEKMRMSTYRNDYKLRNVFWTYMDNL